nr:dipeptidyl-peptidase 5-like [Nerophis lumbriciformis]
MARSDWPDQRPAQRAVRSLSQPALQPIENSGAASKTLQNAPRVTTSGARVSRFPIATQPAVFALLVIAALLSSGVLVATAAAEPRAFDVRDLVMFERLSDPQPSPNGRWVAFTVRSTDLEADKGRTDIWLVPSDGSAAPRRLTENPAADYSPRWAVDGLSLFFLSTRSESSQIWQLKLGGGEARQITDLPVDVDNLVLSPDGRRLAFTAAVAAGCKDLACTAERSKTAADSTVSGQLYDQLFVRHWDTWKDGSRSHLFVWHPGSAEPVDVSAALDADVPSQPFGGAEEITFTPDGTQIVFGARTAGAEEPWSTDFDLFVAPVDGSAAPRRLSDNPAWDTAPTFSPDGRTLAYLAMRRPGYESDRFRIVLRDWQSGRERVLTESWDRSPSGITFSADGRTIYTVAADLGSRPLFAIDVASGEARRLIAGGRVRSPAVIGERLVFGRDSLRSPVELFTSDLDGGDEKRLTDLNRQRLDQVLLGEPEQFTFAGWNGETVHAYLVRPADFDPAKRYPVAFLIHGGPQGSFGDDFHYRWNPQTYAGAGYAAVMVDFHGSVGYGQAFTDSIAGDWGGKPLEDLQKGLAAALERYPFLDGERVCALGASYGGYMINWIAGNWPERFRCLVNHDGLFDLPSMYYSTEELWFPEWEFGGTPWQVPEAYQRHNPANHVDKWQTPMLVVHGAKDYRVVDTQGLAAFTALQRRGVPSQLLYYPDENHWVLKPHNSIQWHETVLAWLDRWTVEKRLPLLASQAIVDAFSTQVGNELGASNQYISIAAYFADEDLDQLSQFFFRQSEEERQHAMKFVHFILEVGATPKMPAIPAPRCEFSSAEDAVQAALAWEKEVTEQIYGLVDLCQQERNHIALRFLDWFVDEQLEEVSTMNTLLGVVQRAGEDNLLYVEDYVVRHGVEGAAGAPNGE